MMTNKFFGIGFVSILLLGCHNNPQSINNHYDNNIATNQIKSLTIDEQLSLLVQNDWQFEKGENLIDENLKLLDGKIMISFAKSTERGEMHDPDYDLNYQYHFSVDAGCNHNSSIVGFDKITNKIVMIKTMTISTLVGCSPDHEKSIRNFIINDNVSYQITKHQLSFTDDKNQTLHFKKME